MLNIRQITKKRQIENFIELSKCPFTVKKVVHETGIGYNTVLYNLKMFRRSGKIKVVDKDNGANIFVKVKVKVKTNDTDKVPDGYIPIAEFCEKMNFTLSRVRGWVNSDGINNLLHHRRRYIHQSEIRHFELLKKEKLTRAESDELLTYVKEGFKNELEGSDDKR